MAQDGACRGARTGQSRFGRPKNRHERNSKTVGEVHRSCIIGEQHTQGSKPLDQFIERGLAREIFRFSVEAPQNFGGEVRSSFRSQNHPGT